MKYQQRTIAHRLAMRRIAPVTVAARAAPVKLIGALTTRRSLGK
jgi:hypothetical protein